MNCECCPYKDRKSCKGLIDLNHKDVVILYDNVSQNDIYTGKLFNDYWGNIMRNVFEKAKLPYDETNVSFMPLISCYNRGSINEKALECCTDDLIERIVKVSPKMIITFGLKAAKIIFPNKSGLAMKYIQGSGQYTSIPELEGVGVFTFDYFIKLNNHPDLIKNTQMQMNNVKYFYANGEFNRPVEPRYAIVDTEIKHKKVMNILEDLDWLNQIVAADLETTSLKYYLGRILCGGITVNKGGLTFVYPADKMYLWKDFTKFKCLKWVWQNGIFDIQWLWDIGYLDARVDEDVMALHYTIDETSGTQNLQNLSTTFLGAVAYKGDADKWIKKSTLEDAPLKVQYERVAIDSCYTYQVYNVLHPMVKRKKNLFRVYRDFLIDGMNALAQVEYKGMPGNKTILKEVLSELTIEKDKLKEEIDVLAEPLWNPEIYKKQSGAKTAPEIFNPKSPKQYSWMIFNALGFKGKFSDNTTAWGNIEHLEGVSPLIAKCKAWDRLDKSIGTYIINIEKIMDKDERIHGNLNLTVAATGRLSSSNPNLQNITKHSRLGKMIRKYFRSEQGRGLLSTDVKSCESRVMASASGDEVMLSVFNEGGDLHNRTAAGIFGEEFTNEERQRAKKVNFGIPYGISAYGLAKPFSVTEGEAQLWLNGWQKTYPQVTAWLAQYSKLGMQNAPLVTPMGRERRFGIKDSRHRSRIENQAPNFIIQSPSSDIVLRAGIEIILEGLLKPYDSYVVVLVHDDITVETPTDAGVIKAVTKIVNDKIREVGARYLKDNIAITCESDYGFDWAKMYRIYDGGMNIHAFGSEGENGFEANENRVTEVLEMLNKKYYGEEEVNAS